MGTRGREGEQQDCTVLLSFCHHIHASLPTFTPSLSLWEGSLKRAAASFCILLSLSLHTVGLNALTLSWFFFHSVFLVLYYIQVDTLGFTDLKKHAAYSFLIKRFRNTSHNEWRNILGLFSSAVYRHTHDLWLKGGSIWKSRSSQQLTRQALPEAWMLLFQLWWVTSVLAFTDRPLPVTFFCLLFSTVGYKCRQTNG